jgi:4-amino-4-deoxy-L-arabinose transferase-like glycosyltransferase
VTTPKRGQTLFRNTTAIWLGGILLAALALRLWNLDHGLPFAYNADEAEHFVPRALDMAGGGSLDPGYYENPPALTYLFALVYWIGGTADAFLTARVVVALIGTLVVALTFFAGQRAFGPRTGLVAAALMAVAFLPVFYSKHALNDIVTLAPVTLGLIGALLVHQRGGWADYVLAGAAIGTATAVKYTAGAMLLTLAVAAGLRILRDRAELRKVLLGCLAAGAAFVVLLAILNPYALLNFHEARRQIKGQSGQAAAGKLGQDDVLGWIYYVGTLGWGLGWLPLAAAVGGAVVAIRRDWRLALLLLAFPVFLYLFMGSQGRYFGRWLLPAYPVLCILAGYGAVALATALKRPALLTALFGAALCAQGLLASVHVDRVLGREDTRAQALDWLRANVPDGGRIVVEPFVPADWAGEFDKWPVERPFQAYEKRLRVKDIDAYREGGYCYVVVGSTQKERGLKAGLRSSERYYPALDDASEETVTFSPFAEGADPVQFSYDFSFNYAPRAYERPGPVVEIHRLADCDPG